MNGFRIRRIEPVSDPLLAGDRWDYADAFEVELDERDAHPAEAWLRIAADNIGPALRRIIAVAHGHVLRFSLDGDQALLGWHLLASEPEVAAMQADGPVLRAVLVARRHTPTSSTASAYLFFHQSLRARAVWTFVRPVHLRVFRLLLERAARQLVDAQPPVGPGLNAVRG